MYVSEQTYKNHAIATQVVKLLGGEWKPRLDGDGKATGTMIRQSDQLHLSFNGGGYSYKGKWHIQGGPAWELQKHKPYKFEGNLSINVSIASNPERIAKEISRRLMPDIEKLNNICRQAHADHLQYIANRTTFSDKIVEACDGFATKSGKEEGTHADLSFHHPESTRWIYGEVKPSVTDQTANITLNSVPISVTLKLMAILNTELRALGYDPNATH